MTPMLISRRSVRSCCYDAGMFCMAVASFSCMVAGAFFAFDLTAATAATVAFAGCWFGAAAGAFWIEHKI